VAIFLPCYLYGDFTSNYGSSWLLVLSRERARCLVLLLNSSNKMGDKAEKLKTKPNWEKKNEA
jgi:hypothetical protein